jgi:membrane protease YdiL (CAAX protease family)
VTAFDHAVTLALAAIVPAYAAWDVPRLAQRVAADPVNARTRDYLWSMAIQWGLTLALIAAWWWAARPISHRGQRLPESPAAWWWTLAIGGVGVAIFGQQAYLVATSPDAQAKVRKQLEAQPGVQTVLPANPREARAFCAVAVTAGICEEVLYRGYLLWYLLTLGPGRLAIAAAAAALIFGVGHAYQGARGIVNTAIAGGISMAVYLLTGSLLAPILLHTTLDLANGLTAYRVLRD